MHRPPYVFISAASADLRTARDAVKEAVLNQQWYPIVQDNFDVPTHRAVVEMLREKIEQCDALIHLVGMRYGFEPQRREAGESRRSYTQLEYDIASKLRKSHQDKFNLYVFVCAETFPYDHPRWGTDEDPECAEKQKLQNEHRCKLLRSDALVVPVNSQEELGRRVRELSYEIESLRRTVEDVREGLRKLRADFWKKLVVSVGVLCLACAIGFPVFFHSREMERHRLAVAVGQSFTILGLSTKGSAQSMFDLSLKKLGFPENQRKILFEEFDNLDLAAQAGRVPAQELDRRKSDLRSKLEAQWRILLGERELAYIEFGAQLSRLWLILAHWEEYSPQSRSVAAEDGLRALRRNLTKVNLPKGITKAVSQLRAADLEDVSTRHSAEQFLKQALNYFDMAPL